MFNEFISIADVKTEDIFKLLALAEKVKRSPRLYQRRLRGHKIALIFEKPSTRTWVSFDAGIEQMGGSTVYLGPDDIKLGVREETRDVARVLDRYLSAVVMRTYEHQTITEFKKYFSKPVINGLSDTEHPCQALADYLTIKENFGDVKTPVVSFVGDGNNVLASLLLFAAKIGSEIRYATPKGLEPNKKILEQAKKIAETTGAKIKGYTDPFKAVSKADVIYGDVWVSMGEENQRDEKLKRFKGFQINDELLSHARKNVRIMHCLPAHRGEEITNSVFESENSVVFDQAENRLHAQKAVLIYLFSHKINNEED